MMQSAESVIPLSDTPTEYIDLSDYCRLCLQVPDESQLLDLHLIYDEEEHLNYYDCFTVCTQIDLRAGGTNAPHQLCKSCGLELQVAYDFHKKVEESKNFLMQLDQSEQSGDEVSALSTAKNIETHGEPEEVGEVEVKTNQPQLSVPLPAESEPIENDIVAGQDDTVGNFETSMEYEELEDHIDMDEYQSVDELVDEDAETVQIKIDNEEYLIQKVNLSAKCKTDVLVDPVHKNQRPARRKFSEYRNKTKPSSEATNLDVENENHVIFTNESTESENELTNNKQNDVAEIDEADAEIDVNSVVISKKGDIKPRRRYSGKYTCDYCQKVFKNRSRMLTHRRSHEPNRPKFECEECGRLYATKQAKDVHIRTFHNRSGLKCPICGKVYVISKLLEVHMRYHTGDFPYVCDLCGQKFAQMCHLNTHKNVKHNSVRYSCEHPGCGKFFTSSASLRNHEFSHSAMPFECAYCKRGYPAKAKLKVHIRQKHGIEASLEQMEDMHIQKDERILSIKLEEDSVHFPVEVPYEDSSPHYSKNETSKNPPVLMNMAPPSDADDINLAEYLFENPDLLPKAQAANEQLNILSKPRKRGRAPLIPGGPPFQCEYCDHKSPSRSLLASHRHRKHRFNKPPNKCAECGKEFATKQQLERHQQRVTCQSYPVFKCEFCEKTCIGRANYQIHLRFHKKVYPFVCHICSKPFMMAQHLNNHVKTKHEGQRFICEQPDCGKMFQTAHALKNHAYTHVDQLPYRCDYCQHDFPTKGRLRWHISRIHGIEHTLDELNCMLVAKEIKLKAQLRPALTPEPEVIDANELEGYPV